MTDDQNKWHLDKRVPLSIVAMLAAQTIALLIWGVQLTSRVGVLEQSNIRAVVERETNRASDTDRRDRIIRLETNYGNVTEQLKSISGKLDQLLIQMRTELSPGQRP